MNDLIEKNMGIMLVLILVAVSFGGAVEILPLMTQKVVTEPIEGLKPLTPLQLEGRDIYIREGCNVCHSQMIRSTPADALRFGERSTIEESMYDRPFQWGSKRTGPDLARVGGKYPHLWHYRHFINPRDVIEQSLMPNYGWLLENKVDFYGLRKKLQVLKNLGVPYSPDQVGNADRLAEEEALRVVAELKEQGAPVTDKLAQSEMVALIAYIQSLGKMKEVKK